MIGDRIRRKREELDMTQEELAEKVGYKHKTSISRIEKNKSDISTSDVEKFAKALGTTVQYLMDWDTDTSAPELSTVRTDGHHADYYIDSETAAIAQEVFDNPDLRLLFDAARDVRPENIKLAAEMLRRFKETNPDD